MSEKSSSGEKLLYCSFCGKSQHEVRKLIAGPSVFICDECIELCNDIIREETASDKGGKGAKSDLPTPREIRNILDQHISHQVVLNQTGVTWIGDESERPEVQPFEVDVRQAVSYVLDVLQREEDVARVYEGHRRILVDYEDVVDPAHPVRGELQDFLGIERRELTTPTRKILERNEALVGNVEDARNALRLMGLADRC